MSKTVVIELSFKRLEKAIIALKLMVDKPMQEDRSNVDAAIQRFEFTIELFWLLLRRLLSEQGVEVRYPKEVLREAYAGKLIDHETLWLQMLVDRNLTSHTYNESLADEIYERIKQYYPVLRSTLDVLLKRFT